MFNIGSGEIALIAVVALLILGPTRLPELARGIGKFMREFRRQTDEVRGVVEREFYKMDADLNEPQVQVRPAQDTLAHGQLEPHEDVNHPAPNHPAPNHPAPNHPVPAADPDALPVPAEHIASQLTSGMPERTAEPTEVPAPSSAAADLKS